MKELILILTLGLASPLLAAPATATDYFKAGEAALKKGDVETAEAAYRKALKLDPTHGNSQYRLKTMKNLTADARIRVRKEKLKSIILTNVTFEDLSLEESLETLGAMIEKASEDTFIPNFVLDDPDRLAADNPVNIRLRNIPASVALKYVLSQGKANLSWDAHVINIRPLSSRKAAAKTTTTKDTKKTTTKEAADPFK